MITSVSILVHPYSSEDPIQPVPSARTRRQPDRALFLFGKWLRVRRRPDAIDGILPDSLSITEAECLIEGDTQEVWGMLADHPANAMIFGGTGFVGDWPVEHIAENAVETVDWSALDGTLYVQETTHSWAEQVGEWATGPIGLRFRQVFLDLPGAVGGRQLLFLPYSDTGDFTFFCPPFKADEGFEYRAQMISIADQQIATASVCVSPIIVPFPGPHDAQTEMFENRLGCLFELLQGERIFATRVRSGGWAPGESGDIAFAAMPEDLPAKWGFADAANVPICWGDIDHEVDEARVEYAHQLFNPTGWHQEYHLRVDEHLMPASRSAISCAIYFDAPNDDGRRRVGAAITALAPVAELSVRWNGEPGLAVEVWLDRAIDVKR